MFDGVIIFMIQKYSHTIYDVERKNNNKKRGILINFPIISLIFHLCFASCSDEQVYALHYANFGPYAIHYMTRNV